jgi:hypothetical protein
MGASDILLLLLLCGLEKAQSKTNTNIEVLLLYSLFYLALLFFLLSLGGAMTCVTLMRALRDDWLKEQSAS